MGGGPSQRQKRTRDGVVTGVDARDGEEAGQDSGGSPAGIWVCLRGRCKYVVDRFMSSAFSRHESSSLSASTV